MLDLIAFELKKIVMRRTSAVAVVGVAVLMCAIMLLNVTGSKTQTMDGTVYAGLDYITHERSVEESHAGALTAERIAADIEAYRDAAFAQIDPARVAAMAPEDLNALLDATYDPATVDMLFDDYYETLFSPWAKQGESAVQTAARVTPDMAGAFYELNAQNLADMLAEGDSTWTFSEAEQAFWLDRMAGVEQPLVWGWTGGWQNILSCLAFFSLVIAAVCVAVTPLFSGEYQDRTDALVLATRHGRSRLVAAKLVAGFAFATGYFALCAAVVVGASLAFFGADGAELALQVVALRCPYAITMGQAALIGVGLAYLITLGFAALTMALSAKLRSQLAIFAIVAVLLFATAVIGGFGNGIVIHIRNLFPLNALNVGTLFWSYMSYPIGPVVLDLRAMVAIVYAVLAVACDACGTRVQEAPGSGVTRAGGRRAGVRADGALDGVEQGRSNRGRSNRLQSAFEVLQPGNKNLFPIGDKVRFDFPKVFHGNPRLVVVEKHPARIDPKLRGVLLRPSFAHMDMRL